MGKYIEMLYAPETVNAKEFARRVMVTINLDRPNREAAR